MRKAIASFAFAVALIAGANLYAADAPKPEAKPDDKKTPMCCIFMDKFNFTAEQKTKATELHKACDKAGCTEAAQKQFFASVKPLLTAEQIKDCYANCEKADRKGCPICGYGAEKTMK